MFNPDGYLPVPHVVAWIAGLGAQGKLDRRLGFVHPGEAADALDLPAEATARFVLGEKLAGGVLTAWAILDPSGVRMPVPAHYWSSGSAAQTMEDGWLDFSAFGLQNDLQIALVILAVDQVAAALGFRFTPAEDLDSRAAVPPASCGTSPAAWKRGRSFRAADEPLIREMRDLITSGRASNPTDAALAVAGKATGKGTARSKAERLAKLYREQKTSAENQSDQR